MKKFGNVNHADFYYNYNDEVDIEILAKEVFSQPDHFIAFLLGLLAIVLNVSMFKQFLSKIRGLLTTHCPLYDQFGNIEYYHWFYCVGFCCECSY